MNKTIAAGVLLSALLSLTGCDYISGTHEAHEAVRGQLTDPGSAQFANEKTYSGGDVCGEVNGKNPLGGYAGFIRYVYGGQLVSLSPGDADFAGYYRTLDSGADFTEALDQIGKACVFAETWNRHCTDQKDAEALTTHQCTLFNNRTLADTNKLRAEVGVQPATR